MKIQGPGSTSSVSASKRKTTSGASQGGFQVETGAQTTASAPMGGASAASSVQSVDAILALQGVEDFTQAKKKATERAMDLLDVLDELKIGLLEGGLPRAKLVALMDLLQTRRDQTHDAKLEAALDEVETRAAVELAKFS
ncbi:flagellar assembly protein FliX [Maricaulis parjimensis]|uniref:flagellar assembly protein FliX n=1 Tax=Maricaulis parjimensis TaxID=144023 RepID=UPI0019398A38|nr:flagellar assembly protein FliX [Maricaulis parjimensis]